MSGTTRHPMDQSQSKADFAVSIVMPGLSFLN
jgi:hypothetical protein